MISNYNLSKRVEVEALIKERQFIIDFFCGEDYDMVESYRQLNNNILLPRSNMSREEIRLKMLQGIYLSLRMRQSDNQLNVNPVKIYEEGRFEMKSTRPNGKSYFGAVKFLHNHLVFQTAWQGHEPHFSSSFFNIGNLYVREYSHVKGIGLTLTRTEIKPIAGLEILVPLKDQPDFEKIRPFTIPMNSKYDLSEYAFLPNDFEEIIGLIKQKGENQLMWNTQ